MFSFHFAELRWVFGVTWSFFFELVLICKPIYCPLVEIFFDVWVSLLVAMFESPLLSLYCPSLFVCDALVFELYNCQVLLLILTSLLILGFRCLLVCIELVGCDVLL